MHYVTTMWASTLACLCDDYQHVYVLRLWSIGYEFWYAYLYYVCIMCVLGVYYVCGTPTA